MMTWEEAMSHDYIHKMRCARAVDVPGFDLLRPPRVILGA
jgi:hypothetical protein